MVLKHSRFASEISYFLNPKYRIFYFVLLFLPPLYLRHAGCNIELYFLVKSSDYQKVLNELVGVYLPNKPRQAREDTTTPRALVAPLAGSDLPLGRGGGEGL